DLHWGAEYHQVGTGNGDDAIEPFIKPNDPRRGSTIVKAQHQLRPDGNPAGATLNNATNRRIAVCSDARAESRHEVDNREATIFGLKERLQDQAVTTVISGNPSFCRARRNQPPPIAAIP